MARSTGSGVYHSDCGHDGEFEYGVPAGGAHTASDPPAGRLDRVQLVAATIAGAGIAARDKRNGLALRLAVGKKPLHHFADLQELVIAERLVEVGTRTQSHHFGAIVFRLRRRHDDDRNIFTGPISPQMFKHLIPAMTGHIQVEQA